MHKTSSKSSHPPRPHPERHSSEEQSSHYESRGAQLLALIAVVKCQQPKCHHGGTAVPVSEPPRQSTCTEISMITGPCSTQSVMQGIQLYECINGECFSRED